MLKKITKIILILTMLFTAVPRWTVMANEPTDTWTQAPDGQWVRTQTAYESVAILASEHISRPEDLFITDAGYLYIADANLAHIAIFDANRNFVTTVGEDYLSNPTGVFVTDYIYVADTDHVFIFNHAGELINQFGRPDSPLFGRGQHFRPRKLAVDARGNIYIIGEAANNGVIQLNANGEFLGYFGANPTQLTFFQMLQRFVLGQVNVTVLPTSPTNIAIAENGVVFTATNMQNYDGIRMLNIAGNDMIDDILSPWHVIDITLGNQGNFFGLTSDGYVIEYDSSGNVLFWFGGTDPAQQRFGILRNPTSLEVAQDGSLYIADAEAGVIHIFAPTEFTQTVHHALAYFEEGLYTQSEQYWREVLRLNASFGLAHQAIGQSRFIQGYHEEALERFTLALDVDGFSESFWELRHAWLMDNMGILIGLFFAYLVLNFILNIYDKKTGKIRGLKRKISETFTSDFFTNLAMAKKIFKKPFDVFYEIKYLKLGSVKFATALYVLIFAALFITLYFPGFVFSTTIVEDLGFLLIATIYIIGLGLFLVVNYLISTINDGEGSFKNIYIATAYALMPFLVIAIPTTVLTHGLTLNEGFVYTALMMLALGWSLLLIILMIKEIHDFSIGATIKNLIMTVAGSVVILAITFIIYIVIFDQMFEFIYSLIWEVLVRV